MGIKGLEGIEEERRKCVFEGTGGVAEDEAEGRRTEKDFQVTILGRRL